MEWFWALVAASISTRVAQKADHESAGLACGNGFAQASFGKDIFRYARPGCLRPLFALILFPAGMARTPHAYGRWYLYLLLRATTLWAALWMDAAAFGLWHMAALASLFCLTLKFDYWSNHIELLASVGCAVGVPVVGGMALGIGLGLGRETLPLLALLGTPAALSVAIGSGLAQATLRRFLRRDPQYDKAEEELQYGKPMWRRNLLVLRGADPPAYSDVAVYAVVAALSFPQAPLLTGALVAITALYARIDEPRVLTMLLPSAATEIVSLARWVS